MLCGLRAVLHARAGQRDRRTEWYRLSFLISDYPPLIHPLSTAVFIENIESLESIEGLENLENLEKIEGTCIIVRDGQQTGEKCCIFAVALRKK